MADSNDATDMNNDDQANPQWTTVTLTIPQDCVHKLYTYAAKLCSQAKKCPKPGQSNSKTTVPQITREIKDLKTLAETTRSPEVQRKLAAEIEFKLSQFSQTLHHSSSYETASETESLDSDISIGKTHRRAKLTQTPISTMEAAEKTGKSINKISKAKSRFQDCKNITFGPEHLNSCIPTKIYHSSDETALLDRKDHLVILYNEQPHTLEPVVEQFKQLGAALCIDEYRQEYRYIITRLSQDIKVHVRCENKDQKKIKTMIRSPELLDFVKRIEFLEKVYDGPMTYAKVSADQEIKDKNKEKPKIKPNIRLK